MLGLLCAVIGILPLLLARKIGAAIVLGLVGWLAFGYLFYSVVPFTVWPWFGGFGLGTAIMLIISCVVILLAGADKYGSLELDGGATTGLVLTVVALLVMVFSPMSGCDMINSQKYAGLIGEVETRTWTQDIQPKDPRHIRMANHENALFLARQAFGQAGAVGSQFEVMEGSITPQIIKKKFCVVVPIDFRSYWAWNDKGNVPGYIVVDGEDPTAEALFVLLPKEKQFKYTPEACFEFNLERHIWRKGYSNYAVTSYTLEIDDNDHPWWTVTLYKPACFAWGQVFAGILLVDPVSGDIQMFEPNKIPKWIDVALPPHIVKNWVNYHGRFQNGFWNANFAGSGVVQAEDPVMVYGSDGEPYYVTGVTSSNNKETSLIGLYYTHTRTGKSVYYSASGSTDKAILNAVNTNSDVHYRRLHGTVPQIYNIHGTMASIVPLLNDNHIYQGVAIVDVKNVQIMGVGKDQFEALRQYERALPLTGHQIAPDLSKALSRQNGVVERITLMPQGTEPIFYLYFKGIPHIFTGGTQLSPKLPLTREGDQVDLEYYASGQSIEPMHGFDNPMIRLSATSQEIQVQAAGATTRKEVENRAKAVNSKFDLEKLSQAEAKQLLEELQQRQAK